MQRQAVSEGFENVHILSHLILAYQFHIHTAHIICTNTMVKIDNIRVPKYPYAYKILWNAIYLRYTGYKTYGHIRSLLHLYFYTILV